MPTMFIIAGKQEAFEFDKSKVVEATMHTVEATIDELREKGYKIFYITKIENRIDDIATEINNK